MGMRKYGTAAENNARGIVVANEDETEREITIAKKEEDEKD